MDLQQNKLLVEWLGDAYLMESKIIEILSKHSMDAEEKPEIQSKINQHLEETKDHKSKVAECLQRMGGDIPSIKEGLSKVMGSIEGMSGLFKKDKLIKNAIAEFTTENLEIATYQAIIAAAEELGEDVIADICKEILVQEEETALWLQDNLDSLVVEMINEKEEETNSDLDPEDEKL